MKKMLLMILVLGGFISSSAYAQPAGDPATILQQMKEKQKPGLIEKVGLTDAQADKVIEINYETRMQAGRELKDLNEADRSKKTCRIEGGEGKEIQRVSDTGTNNSDECILRRDGKEQDQESRKLILH